MRLAPNPLCWGRVCLLLPLHGPVALLVVDPSRVAWSRDVCTLPQAAMAGASPAKVDGKKAAGADRGAGAGKVLPRERGKRKYADDAAEEEAAGRAHEQEQEGSPHIRTTKSLTNREMVHLN